MSEKRIGHYYSVSAIDDWTGWQKVDDVFVHVYSPERLKMHGLLEAPLSYEEDLAPLLVAGMRVARDGAWEGDIREGPYFTVVPDERLCECTRAPMVIAFKQDNNGQCFLFSEVELNFGENWAQEHKTFEY